MSEESDCEIETSAVSVLNVVGFQKKITTDMDSN